MTPDPGSLLGGLSESAFLKRHWQKQPLVVPGALRGRLPSILPDELVRLSHDRRVPSRLVSAPGDGGPGCLRRGPFEAADFEALPADGWTLLVQEADRHVASCAALLERFRFVPNWRVDDVMVSYATDGAGIGPHVDRYDVFLVQIQGRRRWRIADRRGRAEESFVHDHEWVLEPGDMLYLPPGIPHDGVAVGPCVTCSVGFRVPDPRELCSGFLRELPPAAFEKIRYTDPDLCVPEDLGEIPAAARRQLRAAARGLLEGHEFDRWVGRMVTRPLRGDGPPAAKPAEVERLRQHLADGGTLRRSSPSHFVWYREDESADVLLFVGGECYPLGKGNEAEAELLCGRTALGEGALAPLFGRSELAVAVVDLVLRGYLIPVR